MAERKSTRRTDARHASPEVRPASELFERAPPHSPEAEKGVIGSILLDPRRVVDEVSTSLKAEHFYSPTYGKLYEACVALHDAGKVVDATLLIERLTSAGDFEMMGGMQMMLDVAESVPTAINAVHYAKIIRDKFQLRELVHASMENLRDAYDLAGEEDDAVKSVLDRAESRVLRISEDRTADQVTEVSDTLNDLLTMIDSASDKPRGIPTGWHDLDEKVRILEGHLIVIGARPSAGKSALGTSLCENLCLRYGKRGLFVTLEMSRLETAERLLSSLANVTMHALSSGMLTLGQRQRVIQATSELSELKLLIDDTPARSLSDIAAVCRRAKKDTRRGGLDFVVIDYLQLIEPESNRNNENRQEQVSKISRGLKKLARELQVPIFCLAQLNRQVADAKDNRPRLHHLRESGSIENDADQVWFIHREEYYATNEFDRLKHAGKAELIIAKQRNGWVGEVPLTFIKERCRFENAARDEIT